MTITAKRQENTIMSTLDAFHAAAQRGITDLIAYSECMTTTTAAALTTLFS